MVFNVESVRSRLISRSSLRGSPGLTALITASIISASVYPFLTPDSIWLLRLVYDIFSFWPASPICPKTRNSLLKVTSGINSCLVTFSFALILSFLSSPICSSNAQRAFAYVCCSSAYSFLSFSISDWITGDTSSSTGFLRDSMKHRSSLRLSAYCSSSKLSSISSNVPSASLISARLVWPENPWPAGSLHFKWRHTFISSGFSSIRNLELTRSWSCSIFFSKIAWIQSL